jgi:diguanylate cyclase (GGDEF)-like protein
LNTKSLNETHSKIYQTSSIDAELVKLLYTQATGAIIGSFIVASATAYLLRSEFSAYWIFAWYFYMCLITVARYALVKIYERENVNPQPERVQTWYRLFIFITACSSLSWVLVGTILFPSSPGIQAVVSIIIAGISAGGVPYFSGSRLACAIFIVPILTAYSIHLFILRDQQPYYALLAAISPVYLIILLLSAFRTYRSIYNALMLQFQNLDLIKKLDKEIKERIETEHLLRSSKEQYALIMDTLPGLVAYTDNKFHLRFINKAFEVWFEKPLSEIINKHIADILNATDYDTLMGHFSKSTIETISYETLMKFPNEKERYVNVTLIPHIETNVMQGLYLLISDVTPRINYLATHDPLTNLPNRSLFLARFTRAIKYAKTTRKKVGLLFLDLDYFKNINDTLGHDVGDQLLIKVTERLQNNVRSNDMIARLGGDEFTIIFEDITDIGIVNTITQKICRSFENPFHILGKEIFITTSIGISTYPDDGAETQTLIKNADMAMYRAKEQGRNTYEFYTHTMNEKMIRTLTLEANLRSALEKKQFFILYQPIININNNKIETIEALIRWNCPDLGLVMPADFIPAAERIGLITSIGEWILHSTCSQITAWQEQGLPPMKIAINLSAQQFKDYNNLLEKISSILKETKLDGKYLTLEITESSIIDNIDYSIKTINALKKLNITLSLDDFGTGYSSLNYLNRLPVDTIKIDRSFITNLTYNQGAVKIVTAIINMAHTLMLKVIAEGVETDEQYNILKSLGCDAIQGYLAAPPLKAEEIASMQKTGFAFAEHTKQNTRPEPLEPVN